MQVQVEPFLKPQAGITIPSEDFFQNSIFFNKTPVVILKNSGKIWLTGEQGMFLQHLRARLGQKDQFSNVYIILCFLRLRNALFQVCVFKQNPISASFQENVEF